MPALYDETWCARIQLEKMRLIFKYLVKSDSEQKTKPMNKEENAVSMPPSDAEALSQPLGEGALGSLHYSEEIYHGREYDSGFSPR